MHENSIRRFVRLPDVISLGNGVSGVVSIYFSIERAPLYAALAMFVAGIFDFLDGRVARNRGLASSFGKQLDSLCDIVSFILAPVIYAAVFSTVSFWI